MSNLTEADHLPFVSGCWEVTDPQPQPLCCWKAAHQLPECPLVAELRREIRRLRREVARLREPDAMAKTVED